MEQYLKTLEIEPNFGVCRFFLAEAYTAKGMYREAIEEYQKAITLLGERPIVLATFGYTLAVAGRRAEAVSLLNKLMQQSKEKYVAPLSMALVHAGLGDTEQSFAWLEKAYRDRDPWLVQFLKVNPHFDNLRPDPRYSELLRRTGLAE